MSVNTLRVGMKVELINREGIEGSAWLEFGEVYTIANIIGPFLNLFEDPHLLEPHRGWLISRFRPVQSTAKPVSMEEDLALFERIAEEAEQFSKVDILLRALEVAWDRYGVDE